ncbi:MAG TPA: hypothetical protein GX497_10535 [Bacillus bacterium]|nr:hypothetical protein [Bacillus sp. (in: firmicutes)]
MGTIKGMNKSKYGSIASLNGEGFVTIFMVFLSMSGIIKDATGNLNKLDSVSLTFSSLSSVEA